MTFGLTLLETEAGIELPMHPIFYGLLAFGLLMALLFLTLAIGKGRLHS